jgi:gamma-glutamyl-gamma-aminobutyrate hydrolase PuuD
VEAVRDPAAPFVAGIQWHPEWMAPGDAGRLDPMPLLRLFLDACLKARGRSA